MYSIFDEEKLEEFRKQEKLQPFRIKQIYNNIFKNSVIDFDDMTDLSKDLRKKLKGNFYILNLKPLKVLDGPDTTKISFQTKEGYIFESVLMYHWSQDNRIKNRISGDNKFSGKYSDITEKIIRLAYKVYNELGYGLQELVYQKAIIHLLSKEGFKVKKEVKIPIVFDGKEIGYGKVDLLVDDKVVIELKTKPSLNIGDIKQLKKYVSLDNPVGLLVNFGQNKVEIKRTEYNYNPVNPANNPENPAKLNRITICVSSQIGCAVGCRFCVTGKMGFIKNLSYDEILQQILWANNYIRQKFGKKEDKTWWKIRNVVFMGMGEPMLNYDEVKKSIGYMLDQKKLNLSKRHITISTSGIVPGIYKMLEDKLDVMLAISLHSAEENVRSEIMPITHKYPLSELMEALDKYVEQTNNRVFYEYIMIKDLTDTLDAAKALAKLLKGRLAHVNLIPYNENPVVDYETSPEENIKRFKDYLENKGITVTVRQTMGEEQKGACGQLGYEIVKKSRMTEDYIGGQKRIKRSEEKEQW